MEDLRHTHLRKLIPDKHSERLGKQLFSQLENGPREIKDWHKVVQLLNPSPSDSRATPFPATGIWGHFPRAFSIWGRAKETNGVFPPRFPLVHGGHWLFPSCRPSSFSRAPTQPGPSSAGSLRRTSSPQPPSPLREVPRIPPTRAPRVLLAACQALSASPCRGRTHGSRLWVAPGGESRGDPWRNGRSVRKRVAPGSGRLCGPGAR